MVVYVLDSEGRQLEATERFGKVRRLLKNKQAKVVSKSPFTIQLLYDIDNKGDNFMKDIYEICDNQYAKAKDIMSDSDIFNSFNKLKNFVEEKNKELEIINFDVVNGEQLNIHQPDTFSEEEKIKKNSMWSDFIVSRDCFPFLKNLSNLKFFNLMDIREYYEKDVLLCNDLIINARITHVFKEYTEDFVALMNEFISEESKFFDRYCKYIDNFEPIILFVTDSDKIPKVTNYKSMIITPEEYSHVLCKCEEDYKLKDKYDNIIISRLFFNLFALVMIDAKSYYKYPELLNYTYYNGFENYLISDDDTYNLLFNTTCQNKLYNEKDIKSTRIYDTNDTWTLEDMYKHFETHKPDVCIFSSNYILDSINYLKYTTKDKLYKANHIYHAVNIICNNTNDNYIYSAEMKRDILEYFSSKNSDKTYTLDIQYSDFINTANNVLYNYLADYETNKDKIIINIKEAKQLLTSPSKVITSYDKELEYQLIVDKNYYLYKDVFGNVNIIPIDIYIETETMNLIHQLNYKYTTSSSDFENMYYLDLYENSYKAYEITSMAGLIVKGREFIDKIQAVKEILKTSRVLSIEDLQVSIRQRINCIPTVIHVTKEFYTNIEKEYAQHKQFSADEVKDIYDKITDTKSLIYGLDVLKVDGPLANIFLYID